MTRIEFSQHPETQRFLDLMRRDQGMTAHDIAQVSAAVYQWVKHIPVNDRATRDQIRIWFECEY